MLSTASNYGDLDVYAVAEASGDLDLLVINTNPAAAVTNQFNVTGFQPTGRRRSGSTARPKTWRACPATARPR